MLLRISCLPLGAVVPGMAPGTHKRNALVLFVYLLLSLVVLSVAGVGIPSGSG
jgi:hypothetical protein